MVTSNVCLKIMFGDTLTELIDKLAQATKEEFAKNNQQPPKKTTFEKYEECISASNVTSLRDNAIKYLDSIKEEEKFNDNTYQMLLKYITNYACYIVGSVKKTC